VKRHAERVPRGMFFPGLSCARKKEIKILKNGMNEKYICIGSRFGVFFKLCTTDTCVVKYEN
jgi:hypothetical protein